MKTSCDVMIYFSKPDVEKRIGKLVDTSIETTQTQMQNIIKTNKNLRTSKNCFKVSTIRVIGLPGRKEKNSRKNIFEVLMAKDVPKFLIDYNTEYFIYH